MAGNFQEFNGNNGGEDEDAVQANAQDPSGINNANFYTPPDGERPRMRMYIWTITSPKRDCDFENAIIAHEYGHGISNRLTGGPANSDCLSWGESGGLGEGWSDFFGVWLQMQKNDTNTKTMTIGSYVNKKGIRRFPYSTNSSVNPTTYGYLNRPDWERVHAIGEVWGNILYQYYWNLVGKLGFSEDLVVDGLKLQPCRPTFVSARDAILQAEEQATDGSHRCEIWRAFSKRGVGPSAKSNDSAVVEDFSLPTGC
ncbi:neutral protease I [Thamnocephalis sphaerospora]|uniref:Extracellular metalloproteinase n=1 Tax=Thamnocephalis sphaerospora TaxID=78915 RepID=A0A4P9XPW2_9FUNG|nr:neutral protease I [Thamnocephalis sphaerospora]|eukprot:RKP07491.1 neutral protease I [Thamnocephalis sphaerospora]